MTVSFTYVTLALLLVPAASEGSSKAKPSGEVEFGPGMCLYFSAVIQLLQPISATNNKTTAMQKHKM